MTFLNSFSSSSIEESFHLKKFEIYYSSSSIENIFSVVIGGRLKLCPGSPPIFITLELCISEGALYISWFTSLLGLGS